MINKKLIKNITLLENFKQIGQRLDDSQEKNYELNSTHFYIMINSHPTNNGIYLINGYNGSVSVIFESHNGNYSFSYDKSTHIITIVAKGTSRGYLYDTDLSNG